MSIPDLDYSCVRCSAQRQMAAIYRVLYKDGWPAVVSAEIFRSRSPHNAKHFTSMYWGIFLCFHFVYYSTVIIVINTDGKKV